jgi:hypothetical protein
MMQREWVASGEAEAVARPADGYRTPVSPEGIPGRSADGEPVWDDLYRALSPDQQRELLALAERQGLLYAHQLPVPTNGSALDPNHELLTRILAGAGMDVQPLHAEPIAVADEELDAVQREAVARAMATPDILLVQGGPGTGKSRVVAEIICRAAARGERVLFLAPTAAGIDRVLEWVVSRDFVFPVRCVDPDEQAAGLPPAIRALTFAERARALALQALTNARRQAEAEAEWLRQLRQDGPLWAQLNELTQQTETLQAECQALEERHRRLANEIAAQADTMIAEIGEINQSLKEAEVRAEARLAELRGRLDAGRQELAQVDAERSALQPLAEAKQKRRWWTKDWWRATIRGKSSLAQWSNLHKRCRQIQAELDAVQEQIAATQRQWEEARDSFAAKRTERITAEVARRQAELDDRAAGLRHELSILQQKWQNTCQALTFKDLRPKEVTSQGFQTSHSEWRRQLEKTEAQLTFTRQWVACLERTPEVLSMCLPGYFNVVAATLTALARDKQFGGGVSGADHGPDFDLLVVEEADQLIEPQLVHIIRRARRCVLVGDLAWPQRRPGPFQRLWQQLHCDPRRFPYVWIQEAGRLCCRMRHVAPEQRRWITSEHVADFPDIELRILAVPHSQPALAEILFPSSFTIDRAKRYIFQELQELAVQASGSRLRWTEGKDQVVSHLADRDLAHSLVIDLIPGVREILGRAERPERRAGSRQRPGTQGAEATPLPIRDGAAGWETCCVEFDRSAGWDQARAAEWLREHVGVCDLGRTISLERCYRWSGCMEFVPVPAPSGEPGCASIPRPGHGNASVGQRAAKAGGRANTLAPVLPRKGGAGLEIDLADARHRERLPAELRSALPGQGFVNYQEAQAVVRTLANLVKEGGFRELHGGGALETCPTIGNQPAVAVLALYPAQAELIRRLINAEATLAALDGIVEVGVPAAFRQREAPLVLLSLTRSHTHRAVAFGEGPQMLALAMTRARSKLFVFGDPGTLVRRSHWDGPVEHLDQDAAAHERQWITQLVHGLR